MSKINRLVDSYFTVDNKCVLVLSDGEVAKLSIEDCANIFRLAWQCLELPLQECDDIYYRMVDNINDDVPVGVQMEPIDVNSEYDPFCREIMDKN